MASRVTILFDGDRRGRQATFRIARALLESGVQVNVAVMPDGHDPDSIVRAEGTAAIEAVVDAAVDVLDLQLGILEEKGWFDALKERRQALDRLVPTIRACTDSVIRDLYVSRAAEKLRLPSDTVLTACGLRRPMPMMPAPNSETPEQAERFALVAGA